MATIIPAIPDQWPERNTNELNPKDFCKHDNFDAIQLVYRTEKIALLAQHVRTTDIGFYLKNKSKQHLIKNVCIEFVCKFLSDFLSVSRNVNMCAIAFFTRSVLTFL